MTLYHFYVTLTDDAGRVRLQIFGPAEFDRAPETQDEYERVSTALQKLADEKFGAGHEALKFNLVNLSRLN